MKIPCKGEMFCNWGKNYKHHYCSDIIYAFALTGVINYF